MNKNHRKWPGVNLIYLDDVINGHLWPTHLNLMISIESALKLFKKRQKSIKTHVAQVFDVASCLDVKYSDQHDFKKMK